MPEQLFANVASTTLTAQITATQTVFSVTSSANFPDANTPLDQEFRAAFVDEASPPNILEFIAVTNVTGTSWTVIREVEDPARFPKAIRAVGTRVVMVVTRGVLESFERRSRTVGHNVLDYGAVGDSHHNNAGGTDDTAAIQAAYDDAKGSSGQAIVVFPGRRTYRITNSIVVATGGAQSPQTVGLGSLNGAGLVALPTVVWDGAEDGNMFYVGTTSLNIPGSLFRNINIRGHGISGGNSTAGLPKHAIVYWPETGASGTPGTGGTPGTNAAKIDSGSGLDEVWMQRIKGNAVEVAVAGLTNWWIRGGRWDQIDGYAVHVRLASQSIMSVRDVTYDNWDGAATSERSLGMFHFNSRYNGVSGGNTAVLFARFDTLHPEVNNEQRDANANGLTPADKCGVIHCTVDSTAGVSSHNLQIDNTTMQGGTTKSFSWVLGLGGEGATEAQRATQRKNRISVVGRNLRGFSGDGTSATGHVIPIGGVPAADKSPYTSGWYPVLEWSPGISGTDGLFSVEVPKFWRRNASGNVNTNT